MPKKIKVVDVVSNEVNNEVVNEVQEPSVNEEVNEEVNEITSPVGEVIIEEPPINDIEEIPKPKVKAKSKPRPKKQPIEIKEEVKEEVKEDPKPEVKPEKAKQVVELVPCPKCNKMLSQKSLRYSHEKNCPGEVVKTEELPVKRRIKKEEQEQPINKKKDIPIISNSNNTDIPDSIKQELVKTITRQQIRLKQKEDNFNKFKQNIV